MTSRDKILTAVARNQSDLLPLPQVPGFQLQPPDLAEKFASVVVAIGGQVFNVRDYNQVQAILQKDFEPNHRIISSIPELADFADSSSLADVERHQLQNVDLAIKEAHFGVAENGAVWLTDDLLGVRAVPFITQHLAVVLPQSHIVPLMHDAYALIGADDYGYGVFIAGPSKTADIEQSLVLGAHGPRTMTVFLMA